MNGFELARLVDILFLHEEKKKQHIHIPQVSYRAIKIRNEMEIYAILIILE